MRAQSEPQAALTAEVKGVGRKCRGIALSAASYIMYHLLISGNSESWDGPPWDIRTKELSRCINDYTDPALTKKYSALGPSEVNELRRYPCIFAYESGCREDPRFGVLSDVTRRASGVRVEYELRSLEPFISFAQLEEMSFSRISVSGS